MSILYNHIKAIKKKKSGSNQLMNLTSSRNKFIGENEKKYSIAQFNGQQLKGKGYCYVLISVEISIEIITDDVVLPCSNFLISYTKDDNKRFTIYDYSMIDFKKKYGKKLKEKKVKQKTYKGGQDIFLDKSFYKLFANKGAKSYTELFVTLSNTCPEKGNYQSCYLI